MQKHLLFVLGLAILWGLGGFIMGVSIDELFGVPWTVPCTALNVIAGMVMLLLVTRNEHARRLFYEGRKDEQPGMVLIGLLWTFPFSLIVVGLIWWLLAQLLK